VSDLRSRLKTIDACLSINHSLMGAALNPAAAGSVKDRIAQLEAERIEVLALIEARKGATA
jgi:hypothetical protein